MRNSVHQAGDLFEGDRCSRVEVSNCVNAHGVSPKMTEELGQWQGHHHRGTAA